MKNMILPPSGSSNIGFAILEETFTVLVLKTAVKYTLGGNSP